MNPLDPEDHFEPFLKKNMTNETMWAAVSAASDATAVNAEEEVLYDVWDTEMLDKLSIVCACVMNLMCLAGILFNSLSLYIFTRPAFNKRSINVLLAALSSSDLCVCILAIPVFSISQLQVLMPSTGSKLLTATVMLYFYPVTLMFQTMSVWMLVAITIDRYLAVCHPFMVRTYCTRRRALLAVVLITIFSVAYNFVRFWEFGLSLEKSLNSTDVEELLVPLLRDDDLFMLLYQNILTLFTQFFLPLSVLCVLNFEVARTILQAGEQRRTLVSSERREHSTAKMMLFVVLVFILCYTFSFILNVAEILDKKLFTSSVGYLLNDVNNILVVVNSSSSFIFYCKYSTRYRIQLSHMFFLGRLCSKQKEKTNGVLHSEYSTMPTSFGRDTSIHVRSLSAQTNQNSKIALTSQAQRKMSHHKYHVGKRRSSEISLDTTSKGKTSFLSIKHTVIPDRISSQNESSWTSSHSSRSGSALT